MESLKDKVCIVTGAAKGIGKAIATSLFNNGAIVYMLDLNIDEFLWTKDLDPTYERLVPLECDICNMTTVKNIILQIKRQQNHIDVLINNAGIVTYEYLSMIDYEKLRKMFEVNVFSLIYITSLVSRVMSNQKSGSIINMASIVGVNGAKGQLSYSASKGAVISITKSAAKELAPNNIRVNALAPGMVGTERFKKVLETQFKEKINDIPFGRLAEPQEIAQLVTFLASDQSQYITGQIIGIDGGAIV